MTVERQTFMIIGSGLLGRLLAWRLLQMGHQVDIVSDDDRQGHNSAGFIAAAMIAPVTEAIQTEPVVKEIGEKSLSIWPQWLSELPEQIYYRTEGTVVISHPRDQSEMLRFKKRATHLLQENFTELDSQQLGAVEPELAENFSQALLFRDEAWLDNRQLYQILSRVLDSSEYCNWVLDESIEHVSESRISQLASRHFNRQAGNYTAVIDCRGNGAKKDLPGLRSVRGEVIRVHAPEVKLTHAIRLIHPHFPLYLAPRPNHEYVLGATSIESDDMSPVSVRSGLELMSSLYSIHKGFSEARVLEMAVHCRPAMTNNLPIIKRTVWGFHINGLYRHGYLFSPAIISDFLEILLNQAQAQQLQFGRFYDV